MGYYVVVPAGQMDISIGEFSTVIGAERYIEVISPLCSLDLEVKQNPRLLKEEFTVDEICLSVRV